MPPVPYRSTGRPRAVPRPAGFTLLELLVAVTILAVIAVMTWQGLSSLAATRERLAPQNDDVHAILVGLGQMERDLAQAPTSARLFALPVQPVRVLSIDGRAALQILRTADSPDGSRAAAAQTVLYQVVDGALQRQSSPAQRLYQAAGTFTPETVVLVPQVDALQVRVWRNTVGWITPASDADTANTVGVEVRLLRHDGTALRRVFAVG
jgi:general secretion pathway protein J